jgi:hypothetical protein
MKIRSEALTCASVAILAASCSRPAPQRAQYVPVPELESVYGPLFATANHPTSHQHGTGDRLGLFRDQTGTVWGLPLTVAGDGAVLGCAPPGVRDAPITDILPVNAEDIIGGTNAPTGWRGGTGELELVFRNKSGHVQSRAVKSRAVTTGPLCWAQEPPGPPQSLEYYKLARPAR